MPTLVERFNERTSGDPIGIVTRSDVLGFLANH
jgi:hypothetical protein